MCCLSHSYNLHVVCHMNTMCVLIVQRKQLTPCLSNCLSHEYNSHIDCTKKTNNPKSVKLSVTRIQFAYWLYKENNLPIICQMITIICCPSRDFNFTCCLSHEFNTLSSVTWMQFTCSVISHAMLGVFTMSKKPTLCFFLNSPYSVDHKINDTNNLAFIIFMC